jgi:hypothetical protein
LIVRVIQRGPYAKHEEARPRPVIGSIALAPAE